MDPAVAYCGQDIESRVCELAPTWNTLRRFLGHSRRVFLYPMEIAKAMGGLESEPGNIGMGAWRHDIGKLAIPDRILLKPGPLTDIEWQAVRRHATIGYDLLQSISFLAQAAEIVLTHHERYNGSGYPQGLTAEQIPLAARIFSVADAVDAKTSDRPNRAAFPFLAAREEIARGSNLLYDPQAASAFPGASDKTWKAIGQETVKVKPSSVVPPERSSLRARRAISTSMLSSDLGDRAA